MPTARPGFWSKYFYLCMSLLIAAVVFYGFSQTIGEDLLHASPIPPSILTLHAIVFPGWILFFILQSALVRSRNVRLHRTLGWFGVALAISMVVLGTLTSRAMDRFHIQLAPTHQAGINAFFIIQMMDMVLFPITFGLAIYWRRQPDFHRRLMLVATSILTDAAWARFPHSSLTLAYCGVDFLILLGILRDLYVDRRVHKVYLIALPCMILIETFVSYTFTHRSPWWLHIAHAFLR
jgi:hypothetical protein